jgi:hypothetical protein
MQLIWKIFTSTAGIFATLFILAYTASVIGCAAYLGAQASSAWGLLLLLLLPLGAIIFYLLRKRRKQNQIRKIRSEWGTERLVKERELESIKGLFASVPPEAHKTTIDDQTWRDLNMDQLYARIDRTLTDPGEAVLYKMLRQPLMEGEELAKRSRTIRFFQDNPEVREKVQFILLNHGHEFSPHAFFNLLWKTKYPRSRVKPLFTVLALAAMVSIAVPFIFWSAILISVPVGMLVINIITHYSVKRRMDIETISLPYLLACIKTARKLSLVDHPALASYAQKLKKQYSIARNIQKKARFLFPGNQTANDPIGAGYLLEYINIFFLLEIRAFYAAADEIAKHTPELRDLYQTIGEIDALQSAASYRASLPGYAEPEFVREGIHLEVSEARQPLLEKAVPASVGFQKNVVLITGSNMGGKSTFLRNIGTNVLLAQTIATTLTSKYKGNFFQIVTSISRTDDLLAGKSFYYVEAERILRTMQSFQANMPTLCIIDELLSGTNSTERLQASEAIIRYLARQNSLAIIATHDLELAERLDGTCEIYHFTDNVDETGLKFDYRLKPGVATTRNAIALLKYLGYPKEITDEEQGNQ